MRNIPVLALIAVVLAGCATGGSLDSFKPVCKALGANADPKKQGPIRYNSFDPKSRRYAGPDLAPDLKTRNDVGQNLNCPEFKRSIRGRIMGGGN